MNDYWLFSRLIKRDKIKVPEVFCGIMLENPCKEDNTKVKIQRIIDLDKYITNKTDGLGDILILNFSDIHPKPIWFTKRYPDVLFEEYI